MNPGYTGAAVRYARTFLFVPGNRPERFSKAVAAQPDIVVIDLEDAVSAADKDTARGHVDEWLSTGNPGMVRINAVDTDWHEADLALVGEHGVPVMVPKAERADTIRHVARLTPAPVIVPLVESAAGITAAAAPLTSTPNCLRTGYRVPAFTHSRAPGTRTSRSAGPRPATSQWASCGVDRTAALVIEPLAWTSVTRHASRALGHRPATTVSITCALTTPATDRCHSEYRSERKVGNHHHE